MYNKKICILGERAVGKTCLLRRFVNDRFDSDYAGTIGADIHKIQIRVDTDNLQLMVWDIQGQDRSSRQFFDYLKGASAIVYVVDGTRLPTLDAVLEFRREILGRGSRPVPSIMLFNKSDLRSDWEISSTMINDVEMDGMFSLLTSAREGSGVNTAFYLLSRVLTGKTSLVAA